MPTYMETHLSPWATCLRCYALGAGWLNPGALHDKGNEGSIHQCRRSNIVIPRLVKLQYARLTHERCCIQVRCSPRHVCPMGRVPEPPSVAPNEPPANPKFGPARRARGRCDAANPHHIAYIVALSCHLWRRCCGWVGWCAQCTQVNGAVSGLFQLVVWLGGITSCSAHSDVLVVSIDTFFTQRGVQLSAVETCWS